jgi:hypothetical protein
VNATLPSLSVIAARAIVAPHSASPLLPSPCDEFTTSEDEERAASGRATAGTSARGREGLCSRSCRAVLPGGEEGAASCPRPSAEGLRRRKDDERRRLSCLPACLPFAFLVSLEWQGAAWRPRTAPAALERREIQGRGTGAGETPGSAGGGGGRGRGSKTPSPDFCRGDRPH